MLVFQELYILLDFEKIKENAPISPGSIFRNLSESISSTSCGDSPEFDPCRDDKTALILKFVAITTILLTGIIGVTIPLIGKKWRCLNTDSSLFFATKAFAAGVILATGFVHMLPDASEALTNPCLPETPWSKFPFSGFIAMMAALTTLLVDFVSTQYYESKQVKKIHDVQDDSVDSDSESLIVPVAVNENEKVFGEEHGGGIRIVGIHAHAAHHSHNHKQESVNTEGHSHMHSHSFSDDEEGSVRHVVVSQVLELGIVSHSILIGLSLGVSQSPCTIRPLLGALSFHQLFEGFALGGCVSQAKLGALHSTVMSCVFAVTTPLGVGIGTIISSFYNSNSPRALVIEGILDSISAGILVYMALVDLIAADFMSKKMRCNARLQIVSYIALFLGAILMALLAVWS